MRFLSVKLLAALSALLFSGTASAAVYKLPAADEEMVGAASTAAVEPGDNLAILAHRHGVGFRQLIRANPRIDPWAPAAHKSVHLPTTMLLPSAPRQGIVVNVPEMRLYYYPRNSDEVWVFPVAVGRIDWPTPLGATHVRAKSRDPIWYPPESIRAEHAAKGDPLPRAVPPGPDNPLGGFALRLGWPDILIHGTNMPLGGIGMPVTHGCIRMYPHDIETLYQAVPIGTAVNFVDEPYKLGRRQGRWYLEAHAPLALSPQAMPTRAHTASALPKLRQNFGAALKAAPDWMRVETILRQSSGVPTPVSAAQPAAVPAGGTQPARAAATP